MALTKFFKNSPEKAEMSFVDHLEELRWHIMRSVIALLVGTVIVFVNIDYFYNTIVMGPWFHGGWARSDGDLLGNVPFNAKTSLFFRENIVPYLLRLPVRCFLPRPPPAQT